MNWLTSLFEKPTAAAIMTRALEQKKRLSPSAEPQFVQIEGTDVMGIFMP